MAVCQSLKPHEGRAGVRSVDLQGHSYIMFFYNDSLLKKTQTGLWNMPIETVVGHVDCERKRRFLFVCDREGEDTPG